MLLGRIVPFIHGAVHRSVITVAQDAVKHCLTKRVVDTTVVPMTATSVLLGKTALRHFDRVVEAR